MANRLEHTCKRLYLLLSSSNYELSYVRAETLTPEEEEKSQAFNLRYHSMKLKPILAVV
jgi:hypothetical protein